MRKLLFLSVLFLLVSCTTDRSPTDHLGAAMLFTGEFDVFSKVTTAAFEADDRIGVYVVNENQQLAAEDNRVNNVCFKVVADGKITSEPAVYYPNDKQTVTLFAYYPYAARVVDATKFAFSVSEDQTAAENIKKSDLCYARQSVTPSAEVQKLQFSHVLSKVVLNIATGGNVQSIDSMKFTNASTGFTLNLSNGAIALSATKKAIVTNVINGSETIIPPQTFAANAKMLEIEVKLVDGNSEIYYFEPLAPLAIEPSKITTLNLKLNDNKTVTLNDAGVVTDWTSGATSGEIAEKVNNQIKIHWLPAHPRAAEVNRVVLTITEGKTGITKDYEITTSLNANSIFAFDFSPEDLSYPFAVSNIKTFHDNDVIRQGCASSSGTIYKVGAHNIGMSSDPINPPAPDDYININGLLWAKGDLIAASEGSHGGCRVGVPTDYGLYFQFGSLIGWASTGNATISVKPISYTGGTVWGTAGFYANGVAGGIVTSLDAPDTGIGDPCRYYLGGGWRMPIKENYLTLLNNVAESSPWADAGGYWSDIPVGGNIKNLFFPAAGFRNGGDGLLNLGYDGGWFWSASVYGISISSAFYCNGYYVCPQQIHDIHHGFPVRCVSEP